MEYEKLANHSRVWVYQANRFLTNNESNEIKKIGEEFIASWATHGTALNASFTIKNNLFLIFLVDEAQVKASGCSIDSSVGLIKQIEKQYNLDLFDRLSVAYENEGNIEIAKMSKFEELVKANQVNEETIVYNNLVGTKSDLESNWRVAAKNSWHARYLN